MLTKSGLNDLITAVYLAVAAWEAGTSLLVHCVPLKLETLTALLVLHSYSPLAYFAREARQG